MQRESRLVLTVLLLVILPTAILSLLAARNLSAWEIVQEKRIEGLASNAIRLVTEDVLARLTAVQGDASRETARWLSRRADLRDFLPVAAGLSLSNDVVSQVFLYRAPSGIVYPPAALRSDAVPASRARWANLLRESPYAAALDQAAAFQYQNRQLDDAIREYEKILQGREAEAEMQCEAALRLSQCDWKANRIEAAVAALRRIARGGSSSESGTGAALGDVRDQEGYLYSLVALQELTDVQEEAGQIQAAVDSELALFDSLVARYDGLVPAQIQTVAAHVQGRLWPLLDKGEDDSWGPEAKARAIQLRLLLKERERSQQESEAERTALSAALAKRASSFAAEQGRIWWIRTEYSLYVFGRVAETPEYCAGFKIRLKGLERLIRSASAAAAQPQGLLILASGLDETEPVEPSAPDLSHGRRVLEKEMPAPFQFVRLRARVTSPAEVERSGRALARLYVWGILLLCGGVLIGSWIVIQRAAREIRQARARTDFVAGVSHDLRTPLASMKMLAESLYLGNVKDAEKQKKFLEVMVKEIDRLWGLIEKVLFFVRLGQDALMYHMSEENIGDVVSSASKRFTDRLAGGSAELRVDIADNLPVVLADASAIEQTLLNLLDNALKYSRERKEIRVAADAVKGGREVRISVSDRGIGIERHQFRRIFKKFYRVKSQTTNGISGVGLGLALCKHVVRAHGGRIELQSRPGEGSTFSILLPAAPRR